MTDRIAALTVVLKDNIRDDDAQPIIDAILMLRGVVSVKWHVTSLDIYVGYERAKRELSEKLYKVLYQEDEK